MLKRYTHLAVVKVAGHGQVVDVGVQHRRHLEFLDGAHAALGVEHEDRDVLFPAKAVDGGRACVTACRAHHGEVVPVAPRLPLVPAHQEVLEQVAEELQRHVLEGKGRPVEELQEVDVVLEVDQGGDLLGAEGRVAAADDVLEVIGGDLRGRDVERQDVEGEVNEREVLPGLPPLGDGDRLRDVQAAVGGEALEDDLLKGELLLFKASVGVLVSFDACATRWLTREEKSRSRRGDCLHRCHCPACSNSAATWCASGRTCRWERRRWSCWVGGWDMEGARLVMGSRCGWTQLVRSRRRRRRRRRSQQIQRNNSVVKGESEAGRKVVPSIGERGRKMLTLPRTD